MMKPSHEVEKGIKAAESNEIEREIKTEECNEMETEIKIEQNSNLEHHEDGFEIPKKTLKRKRVKYNKYLESLEDFCTESAGKRPYLPPASNVEPIHFEKKKLVQLQKIAVPRNRFTPLKQQWMSIFTPVVEQLHLQIRFNIRSGHVELKTCKDTKHSSALQKGVDFVRAFIYGFAISDALVLIRLDEMFLETFTINDVKFSLKGDHLGRAVGRLAGKSGRTKFTIENVSKTRIVIADKKIHILGSYKNIAIARRAICNLILGRTPGKVYGNLRGVASRAASSF